MALLYRITGISLLILFIGLVIKEQSDRDLVVIMFAIMFSFIMANSADVGRLKQDVTDLENKMIKERK